MPGKVYFQPGEASGNPARLYYIDWLRVIAIWVVFLFHAVHVFDQSGWHIKNLEQSEVLTIILYFMAMWGMPFFFMIAGAGSWFALGRRSARQYATERFWRLLIPFFVGTLLLALPSWYLQWKLGQIRGDALGAFFPWLWDTGPRSLSPELAGWGQHLWFLGFLYLFAMITLPFFLWLRGERGRRFLDWLAEICTRRFGILVFLVPLFIIQMGLRSFFPAEHGWTDFTFQMAFFAIGYILLSDERFTQAVRRERWLTLGLGCLALFTLVGMYLGGVPLEAYFDMPGEPGFFMLYAFITVIALSWCLFMVYIGMRFLDFNNSTLQYWREASLPFFVLHQPVIILVAFFVVQWQMPWWLKMLIEVPAAFFICLGLYEFVIRRVKVLRMAFGMPVQPARPHGDMFAPTS